MTDDSELFQTLSPFMHARLGLLFQTSVCVTGGIKILKYTMSSSLSFWNYQEGHISLISNSRILIKTTIKHLLSFL